MAEERQSREESDASARSGGSNIRHWILGIAILLLAIIALQNSQSVQMDFLFVDAEAPLVVALLIAGLLGAIIGYVAPLVRSHRRDQRKHGKG